MTYLEMCTDIANEVNKRQLILTCGAGRIIDGRDAPVTAEQIYNYDSHGELFMIHIWYWTLFPERLPADVENPADGALRYSEGKIQVWSSRRGWE